MNDAAAEELRLCWHAASIEAHTVTPGQRAFNSEAFQRVLWRHREALMRLVEDRPDLDDLLEQRKAALLPFGRAASVLPPGQNPVLLSLPSREDGGFTFVQLRPEHFRRAAALSGVTL